MERRCTCVHKINNANQIKYNTLGELASHDSAVLSLVVVAFWHRGRTLNKEEDESSGLFLKYSQKESDDDGDVLKDNRTSSAFK